MTSSNTPPTDLRPIEPAGPHLRVADRDDPTRVLGVVHRGADGRWAYDFVPGERGQLARERFVELVGRLGVLEIPLVEFDDDGRPRTDDDGALCLAGTIPDDTDDVETYLRSLAAFADAWFAVEYVP